MTNRRLIGVGILHYSDLLGAPLGVLLSQKVTDSPDEERSPKRRRGKSFRSFSDGSSSVKEIALMIALSSQFTGSAILPAPQSHTVSVDNKPTGWQLRPPKTNRRPSMEQHGRQSGLGESTARRARTPLPAILTQDLSKLPSTPISPAIDASEPSEPSAESATAVPAPQRRTSANESAVIKNPTDEESTYPAPQSSAESATSTP
ncbi:hypothetical protein C8R44DRAFT_755240 [Mycena epipterygia]|nr:hypothetical protein C8R44DRAFT_755240 [Mycena epipterygia]